MRGYRAYGETSDGTRIDLGLHDGSDDAHARIADHMEQVSLTFGVDTATVSQQGASVVAEWDNGEQITYTVRYLRT